MSLILSVSSLLLASTLVSADATTYDVNAICTCDQMMRYYQTSIAGLWGTTYWGSGILMASLADISALDPSYNATYFSTYASTYNDAPATVGSGFIDGYYDDEGWWANGWITVYDLTQDPDYLNMAISLYNDMAGGYNTPCGGIYWSKDDNYIASIANELYITLAASLANRVSSDQSQGYLDAAVTAWDWFFDIGVVGEDWLVVDGVNVSTCQPVGIQYSYNQGVILSAAVELYHATGNETYLEYAGNIANATTAINSTLTGANGVILDCHNGPCDTTGAMFKGPWFRGLRQLQLAYPHDNWVDYITTNAQSLWNNALNDTDGQCNTGADFSGPMSDVNEVTQGAALDCLVAAWAVTST